MLNGDSFECNFIIQKENKSELELHAPYYYINIHFLRLFLKKTVQIFKLVNVLLQC
jgi:hypothetical protein